MSCFEGRESSFHPHQVSTSAKTRQIRRSFGQISTKICPVLLPFNSLECLHSMLYFVYSIFPYDAGYPKC